MNSNYRDNIIQYKQRLNINNAEFVHITHDDAMVATVYKINHPPNLQYILKVCDRSNDYLRELYFLKYFSKILPVPQIIQTVEPDKNIHGAILMQYLPGDLVKPENISDEITYQLGELLAKIHANRTKGFGDLAQDLQLSDDPRVHFGAKFSEGISECQDHLPNELIDKCCAYYESHKKLLNFVDGPCIIHRDFRPANIIVSNNQIQGIIDWSSARASFAEDDFCPLEHGEWTEINNHKESLLAGYASIRKIPDYSSIMPLLRLNRAVALIGFTVKHNTWQNINARHYKSERNFCEDFFR